MTRSEGIFPIPATSQVVLFQQQTSKAESEDLKANAIVSHRPSDAPAPISRLPVETLSTIFSYVQEYDYEKPEIRDIATCFPLPVWIDGPEDTTPCLMALSQACSHWRRAAIQTPALWSCVSLMRNPEWTSTVLQRARSTPLTIMYSRDNDLLPDDQRDLTPKAMEVVMDHISNTRRLHIAANAQALEALLSKLTIPAPVLDAVTFIAYSDREDIEEASFVSRIPPDLFDGDAPNIRTLTLSNCVVPWTSSRFHNIVQSLVSLAIYLTHSDELWAVDHSAGVTIPRSDLFPSLPKLRVLLSSATRLERLVLHSILPECTSFEFRQEEAIYLPNLKSCDLEGNVYDCAVVARHIYASPDSRLELQCFFEEDEGNEADYAAVVTALEHHLSFWNHSSTSTDPSEITLNLYNDCVRIVCDAYELVVHSERDTLRDDLTRTCLALLPSPAPTKLLFYHTWTIETDSDLISILSTKPLHTITEVVTTIVTNLLAFQRLCDALCLCERSEPQAGATIPPEQVIQHGTFRLFPQLRVLSMKWPFPQDLDQGLLRSLQRAIDLRREYGSPIERVELRGCRDVGGTALEGLRSIPGLQILYDDPAPVVDEESILQE